MWSALARRATCISAASWTLVQAIRSTAIAEVQAPATCSHAAAASNAAAAQSATAPGHNLSSAAAAPDSSSRATHPNPPSATTTAAAASQQGPAALKEGQHFAVVSGVDGTSSKLSSVAAAMRQADVVLLGEYHDDAVAHALQLALLQHVANRLGYHTPPQSRTSQQPPAHQQPQQTMTQQQQQPNQIEKQQQPSRPLILSLEMFETDVQPVLSEYLAGLIPLSDLMRDARPWSNYRHDYHHLVELCKQLSLPVVAANAPRRYVSLAGRGGSGALLRLPEGVRQQWLPPLPHAASSQAYVRKVQQNMQQAAVGMDAFRRQQQAGQQAQQGVVDAGRQQGGSDHHHQQQDEEDEQASSGRKGCPYIGLTVSSNFLAAQSLWDATMAYRIAQALQQHAQPQQQQQQQPQQQQQQQQQGGAGSHTLQPAPTQPHPRAAAPVNGSSSSADGSSEGSQAGGPLVVHVCGKFHCEDRLGIPEHLAGYAPGAKVLVVVFTPSEQPAQVTAEQVAAAGLLGTADFVVLTDSRLPRSFIVEHPV